ncbi:hypothetical protein ACTXT7_010675 [Hymenolepis weldensis]
MCLIGSLVTLITCHVRGHGFDSHRWLSLDNIEGGRVRVPYQEGSMKSLSTQDERRKRFLNGFGNYLLKTA